MALLGFNPLSPSCPSLSRWLWRSVAAWWRTWVWSTRESTEFLGTTPWCHCFRISSIRALTSTLQRRWENKHQTMDNKQVWGAEGKSSNCSLLGCWQKWQDLNVVSSLLKSFFRKLPEPLFTNGACKLMATGPHMCITASSCCAFISNLVKMIYWLMILISSQTSTMTSLMLIGWRTPQRDWKPWRNWCVCWGLWMNRPWCVCVWRRSRRFNKFLSFFVSLDPRPPRSLLPHSQVPDWPPEDCSWQLW